MGGSSSQWPCHHLGGQGLLPRPWLVLKEGVQGGSSSQRPGSNSLGGRGVLPRRWSVLKEGLQGAVAPRGPGTPAWGDGESCPNGGCLGRTAQGGSTGHSSSQGPGTLA